MIFCGRHNRYEVRESAGCEVAWVTAELPAEARQEWWYQMFGPPVQPCTPPDVEVVLQRLNAPRSPDESHGMTLDELLDNIDTALADHHG